MKRENYSHYVILVLFLMFLMTLFCVITLLYIFSSSMRSAVSVILSSPTPDPNMSRPDYDQTIHDHAALLILVRHIGNAKVGFNDTF